MCGGGRGGALAAIRPAFARCSRTERRWKSWRIAVSVGDGDLDAAFLNNDSYGWPTPSPTPAPPASIRPRLLTRSNRTNKRHPRCRPRRISDRPADRPSSENTQFGRRESRCWSKRVSSWFADGASVATSCVSRKAWRVVGGFDARLLPAQEIDGGTCA